MADNLKHTPGPWRAVQTRVVAGTKAVALVVSLGEHAYQDARLIAAAPELRMALIKAEEWLTYAPENVLEEVRDALRAAGEEL